MQIIKIENGLNLELEMNEFTAKITYSPRTKSYIFIPRYIKYQNHDYSIISITKGSFKENKTISTIKIPEDSNLMSIEKNAFYNSTLEKIFIPPSVKNLQEGWCNNTFYLNQIVVSPNNQFLKYTNNQHQIIVGKSDNSIQNYDVLIFAIRNIESAIIPDYIKYIDPYAFEYCNKLENIEISENSELISIGKNAFTNTKISHLFIPKNCQKLQDGWCHHLQNLNFMSISQDNQNFKYADDENLLIIGKSDINNENYDVLVFASRDIEQAYIPKDVIRINSSVFEHCTNLFHIAIDEKSEMRSIGKNAFADTLLHCILIPSTVDDLQEGWCKNTKYLNKVYLYSNNKNYKYADLQHQIIVGKNDKNGKKYDVLVFASRKIHDALIPEDIKYIGSYSFEHCKHLFIRNYEFLNFIQSIGKSAFAYANLYSFTISKNIHTIGKAAFCQLKVYYFEIEAGSNLNSISDSLFEGCKFSYLDIPNDSKIKSIGKKSFKNTSIDNFFIPTSVIDFTDKSFNHLSISFSPNNQRFSYADKNHQIIIGKIDTNDENFDTIFYATSKIKKAIIPNYIKHINSNAFKKCEKLKEIEISENSQLLSIGKAAFSNTKIKRILIPKNVSKLLEKTFYGCYELRCFEFLGDYLDFIPNVVDYCRKLTLISFPNIQIIEFNHGCSSYASCNISLFICAGAKFILR